jgi:hypothetical protein
MIDRGEMTEASGQTVAFDHGFGGHAFNAVSFLSNDTASEPTPRLAR